MSPCEVESVRPWVGLLGVAVLTAVAVLLTRALDKGRRAPFDQSDLARKTTITERPPDPPPMRGYQPRARNGVARPPPRSP